MNKQLVEFEGNDIEMMIGENGEPLFELYGVDMALGYTNKAKGKIYPYKIRINKTLENAEIEPIIHCEKQYITLSDLRKFITVSNTRKKHDFIEWLKENSLETLI